MDVGDKNHVVKCSTCPSEAEQRLQVQIDHDPLQQELLEKKAPPSCGCNAWGGFLARANCLRARGGKGSLDFLGAGFSGHEEGRMEQKVGPQGF